jgi:3-oxoacyl-[acyl-carrier protein] reductase
MRLAGKVAIVTGGSSGIGKASAYLFAKEGARVVVADVDETGGRQTVSMITERKGEAVFVHTDVSLASDVEHLINAAVGHYSQIDILFNNAGIYMRRIEIEDVEESLWDRIYSVNIKGAFLGTKFAVPVMKRLGGGSIINTASMAAVRPSRGLSAYASSKGALITLTKALAVELSPHKIRVNCICPALTDTPMIEAEMEELRRASGPSRPLPRLARPEDIASVALFLASSESLMLSGTCLDVNGGQIA